MGALSVMNLPKEVPIFLLLLVLPILLDFTAIHYLLLPNTNTHIPTLVSMTEVRSCSPETHMCLECF